MVTPLGSWWLLRTRNVAEAMRMWPSASRCRTWPISSASRRGTRCPTSSSELAEVVQNDSFYCIVGKIVNTAVEEAVLDEKGKVAPDRLEALVFDQFQHGYYVVGEKVGKAWNAGAALMKK